MRNARGVHRSLWWVIGGAWVFLVSVGEAAEPPKKSPAGTEPAASASVAATQRDLDRIRAASDPRLSGLATSSGPRVSVPELRTDSVESPIVVAPTPSAIRGVQPEKNASNWLVDAMDQGARDREERQRAALGLPPRREERDALGRTEYRPDAPFGSGHPAGTYRSGSDDERKRDAELNRGEGAAKRARAENPLANYLGDWLRPQDYALLAPGLTGVTGGSPAALGTGYATLGTGYSESAAGLTDATRALPGGAGHKSQTSGAFAPATASLPPSVFGTTRDNPFLAGLSEAPKNSTPAPAISPPLSVVGPSPEASRTGPMLRGPDAPPPAPKVPDVAKPRPDETYFKQLKRF